MKKKTNMLLAFVLIFTMCMPVLSLADTTYTITIKGAVKGHTYDAYQIFDGDLYEKGSTKTLSNIVFGSGIDSTKTSAFLAEFKTDNGTSKVAVEDAKDLAKAYAESNLYKADGTTKVTAKEFARIASKYTSSVKTSGTSSISGLDAGYYLVKDATTPADPTTDSVSAFMTQVVSNVEVTTKTGDVDIEKKVKDIADSVSDEMTDWQDSADFDIGDDVPFKLTAHLPENLDDYDTYKLVFHDTQGAGLTFDKSTVNVYVADSKVTSGYTVKTDGLKTGETFNIVFDDIKTVEGAANGAEVRVEYKSELNSNAVLGSAGNPNTVYLEYSNNPNLVENMTTANTQTDKVIVFTYKLVVNKIDENGDPLKGAGFTLFKKNAQGKYVKIGEEIKGTNLSTFEWKGIDDGSYKLSETTVPEGFNNFDDCIFEVSATHDTSSDNPKLTVLEGGDMFTGLASEGTLTGSVVNKAGSILPVTGGNGTRIIHLCGISFILGALVIFIAKRKYALK